MRVECANRYLCAAMTDLEELNKAATQGEWGAFDDINDHIISTPLVSGAYQYPSPDQMDTPDGAFITALVNAYRSGNLREVGEGEVVVPRPLLTRAAEFMQFAEDVPTQERSARECREDLQALLAAKDATG